MGFDSPMDSSLHVRPWTPPETEPEPSPRSDYFSESFRSPDSTYASFTEHRWPPPRLDSPAHFGARCDTPTEDHRQSRPKPISAHTEPAPYTPTKTYSLGCAIDPHGARRYPYTPDSSRLVRRNTEFASSPSPWDDYPESSSPVQHALSSCIAHFENLIHTQHPDADQMEYILAQFENMTSFLTAPKSQSKITDEHLFADAEGTGLGISGMTDEVHGVGLHGGSDGVNQAYVAEVGKYIEGIRGYIEDLKMRLDEVKTLNGIQLDVIHDLRRQMKTVRQGMRTSLDMREDVDASENEQTGGEARSRKIEPAAAQDGGEDAQTASQDEGHDFGIESWETVPNSDNEGDVTAPSPSQRLEDLQKDIADRAGEIASTAPRRRIVTIIRKPERRTFWGSFGEALDKFGDLLLEG